VLARDELISDRSTTGQALNAIMVMVADKTAMENKSKSERPSAFTRPRKRSIRT
jgi:hypothetical protein